ncbi:MAG TPA: hypothetical protein VG270_07765 [Pseudolabrys sp.]|jgi:hypothetical protein|nr:hypothetical protein [Pseudolabrys sp.]
MSPSRIELTAIGLGVLGVIGCIVGAIIYPDAFFRAWLCSYLFWLGVPLAGVTLVLVHDLSGGAWMATARGPLTAAAFTMPLASLAGIPAFIGLHSLYSWTHPAPDLGNVFYLNPVAFFIRYGCYVIVWNVMAAFVVFGPRQGRLPISPALSWISGICLVVLAFSTGFAAIDWILSLEPKFWSSIFPYTQSASWFNTGFALVLLTIALVGWPAADRRKHMVDLTQILLATTIFWAYLEFMQFLIIWEENLKHEIPWYLKRLDSVWHPAIYVSAGLGFIVPFFVLLWAPSKRRRAVVGTICVLILISRLANTWLLVMPEFGGGTSLWLDVAATLALGGAMLLLFAFALSGLPRIRARFPAWRLDHA